MLFYHNFPNQSHSHHGWLPNYTYTIYIYIYTYHTSSIQLGLQVDANMSSMSKMSSPIPPAPGVADQLQPSTRAGGAVQRPWPQSGRSKVDLIYIYIYKYWLVVWNMFYFFHNIWDNPSQLTFRFFRG